MSTGIPNIKAGLTPYQAWKYELMMADMYAPLDVVCECDAQEYAYQKAFEEIIESGLLNEYEGKEWLQDGLVEDSYFRSNESPDVNPEIYQLLLSNSVEDAQKLQLMLDIAWWKAAREKAVENVDGESADDCDEDQMQISRDYGIGSRYPQRLCA